MIVRLFFFLIRHADWSFISVSLLVVIQNIVAIQIHVE